MNDEAMQEVNGYIITMSPDGVWHIVDSQGVVISKQDTREDAIRYALSIDSGN